MEVVIINTKSAQPCVRIVRHPSFVVMYIDFKEGYAHNQFTMHVDSLDDLRAFAESIIEQVDALTVPADEPAVLVEGA